MASVARKSVINILWASFSFAATKLLNLVAIIILARLLSPGEIGLMAFCLVIMAYLEVMARFGLGAALISAGPDPDEVAETADAVFAMSIGFSAAMAGLLFLSSGAIASFFEQPELAPMLRLLCAAILLQAFGTVNNAFLQKNLNFRLKVFPDIGRGLVKGVTSIGFALAGAGVWSLVYGHLAGVAVYCVVLWAVQPWRPARLPRPAAMRRLLGFGSSLLGAESINMLNRTLAPLMIGKVLGAAPLGIYNLASRIPDLGIRSFTLVASTVAHPIMAQMQDDPESLRRYFYDCLCYFSLFTFAGGAAIASLAEPMVVVLYTPTWYDMIVPMQLLAVAYGLSTVNLLPGVIYKAIRRPDYMLRVSLMTLPVTVLALWFAVPRGLEAVALAEVALALIYFVPNVGILRGAIGISIRQCLRAVAPGLFCGLMTAAGGQVGQMITDTPLGDLLCGAALAGLAYAVSFALVRPDIMALAARRLTRGKRAT